MLFVHDDEILKISLLSCLHASKLWDLKKNVFFYFLKNSNTHDASHILKDKDFFVEKTLCWDIQFLFKNSLVENSICIIFFM